MKKTYQKPSTELFRVSAPKLLNGSPINSELDDEPAVKPGKSRMDNGVWDDEEEDCWDDEEEEDYHNNW